MPRLQNSYWAAGVGGGIASVGAYWLQNPIAQWPNSGYTCWLQPYLALWQNGGHLETLNLQNGAYNQAFDAQGCYQLAAGGGVYAAQFSDGVRISNQPGVRYHNAGGSGEWAVGDVAPDGTVTLIRPDGTIDGSGVVPAAGSVQGLGGGAWLALGAGYRPIASSPELIPKTMAGRLGGLRVKNDLVLYHAEEQNGQLMLHERTVNWGVVLATGLPACWRPDFEEQPDGSIVVLYANNQGEPPGTLVQIHTNRGLFYPLDGIA